MKKLIKENSKLILGFILGGLMFGGLTGLFAYALNASEVSFTPTDTNWKVNDTTVGDVKTALDDLYTKANYTINKFGKLEMTFMCPNCVYVFDTENAYYIGSDLSSIKYYENYEELFSQGHTNILGFILDENNKITKMYSCTRYNEMPYCLAGSSDGSEYEYNNKILETIYGIYDSNFNPNGCQLRGDGSSGFYYYIKNNSQEIYNIYNGRVNTITGPVDSCVASSYSICFTA